jgi:hypothetical protein
MPRLGGVTPRFEPDPNVLRVVFLARALHADTIGRLAIAVAFTVRHQVNAQ